MQTQTTGRGLPKFTDVISIEISVDAIYRKLMDTFPADYQHKETLAHAIVGSANRSGGLSYIFNALNGYTNDVDFSVGDGLICSENERKEYYDANLQTEDGKPKQVVDVDAKPNWKVRWRKIGNCEVVEIDMYRSDKLRVEFRNETSQGVYEMETKWVNHKKCTEMSGNNYPQLATVESVAH